MNFATNSSRTRILVWVIWFIVLFTFFQPAVLGETDPFVTTPLLGVVAHDPRDGPLFPWQPRTRWKKHALRKYRAWRRAYHRARWAARGARLAMQGVVTLAQLVDWLTLRQRPYQVGALPVLYALLETLPVRHLINRHCPSRGDVDPGTVALVLVLNRLLFPLPLYWVADGVGPTTLVHLPDIPAAKFNDDRLGRTLDALSPHLEAIWLAGVERALLKADVDLSVIFYDLTAFITHGRDAESDIVDFGVAHNTPMNKRKFKLGLNATADGNLPWLYRCWSSRTADQATVAPNMAALAGWLQKRGDSLAETLVVGDRAMRDDEIALAYERTGLRYLAGLRCAKTEYKALLRPWTTEQFMDFPLDAGDTPQYGGRGCIVSFAHKGRTVRHRGWVVLAGPIREQRRQRRQAHLAALEQELIKLRAKGGQPYYRTVKRVRRSANARCRGSKGGPLMSVQVKETGDGNIDLRWQIDPHALWQAEEREGRYLLVTNDWSLSHTERFARYRQKDGVEKRFRLCKSDLKVSPVYLHQDQRMASMWLLNRSALLAYRLLERQGRQHGLQLTTRQLIQRLETVTLIETHCRDGSCLRRLTPLTPEVVLILRLVAEALEELMTSPAVGRMPMLAAGPSPSPPPPFPDQEARMSRLC